MEKYAQGKTIIVVEPYLFSQNLTLQYNTTMYQSEYFQEIYLTLSHQDIYLTQKV